MNPKLDRVGAGSEKAGRFGVAEPLVLHELERSPLRVGGLPKLSHDDRFELPRISLLLGARGGRELERQPCFVGRTEPLASTAASRVDQRTPCDRKEPGADRTARHVAGPPDMYL